MNTTSNIIVLERFRRPNSLANLPVPLDRPVPSDAQWLLKMLGGTLVVFAAVKLYKRLKK